MPTLREFNIKEREIKHKKPIHTFLAEEPIALGSPEFHTLMKDMNIRREKEEDTTLNVVILPNKEIWLLPSRFQGGQRSQHSIVAKGNPCVWAGEVKIKDNKVISINDRSGHCRTLDYNDKVQKALNDFALQAFKNQGYEVPREVELTIKYHGNDKPSLFQEGQKSQHSIVAKGNPCVWAGEVELEGNKIIGINDKSGHYKTYAYSDHEQKEIDTFALEAFRQQGYDVPQAIEHTVKRYDSDLASPPRSQNEKASQQPANPR